MCDLLHRRRRRRVLEHQSSIPCPLCHHRNVSYKKPTTTKPLPQTLKSTSFLLCWSYSSMAEIDDTIAIEKFFNGGRCEGRQSTVLHSSPVISSKEDEGEDPPVLIFVGLRRRSTIGIRNREAPPVLHRFKEGGGKYRFPVSLP
ncbi:unnamed protein product [Lactuca saligna]|uniref:Uncharacterized protein n=1 Tax=Lactuca saligna TaxID=75948 RepID=A0AA36E386_LACSI|nr:unnamed protein product [Lactuca saligna]